MSWLSKLLLFTLAPLIGLAVTVYGFTAEPEELFFPAEPVDAAVVSIGSQVDGIYESMGLMAEDAAVLEEVSKQQKNVLEELAAAVSSQKERSEEIYEERILAMLGPPVKTHQSSRVEIKVFQLDELGYRGYIAKVKLHDPSALKVVLAQDTLGKKETTLEAVERTGAIFGVNGGGFYTEQRNGESYSVHMGNVIINGKLITPFNPYPENLFFAGINNRGKFIGGIFYEEEHLMSLRPWQGVSFVPVLIKGGMARPIDSEWVETKHPRTIIGEYANGDLIFIVVDGRQSDWSVGVTLERLLDKLVELGVKEGYNLDGGGSSTFVYDGEILNRPSDGKPRPVVTNFIIMP